MKIILAAVVCSLFWVEMTSAQAPYCSDVYSRFERVKSQALSIHSTAVTNVQDYKDIYIEKPQKVIPVVCKIKEALEELKNLLEDCDLEDPIKQKWIISLEQVLQVYRNMCHPSRLLTIGDSLKSSLRTVTGFVSQIESFKEEILSVDTSAISCDVLRQRVEKYEVRLQQLSMTWKQQHSSLYDDIMGPITVSRGRCFQPVHSTHPFQPVEGGCGSEGPVNQPVYGGPAIQPVHHYPTYIEGDYNADNYAQSAGSLQQNQIGLANLQSGQTNLLNNLLKGATIL